MPPKGLRQRGLSQSSYLSVSAEIRREQCPSDSERLRDSSVVDLPRNLSWQQSGPGIHRLGDAGTDSPASWDNPSLSTASALNRDRLLWVESLYQSLLEYAQIADEQEDALETGRVVDQETVADSLDSQTLLLQEMEGVARVIRAKDASTIPGTGGTGFRNGTKNLAGRSRYSPRIFRSAIRTSHHGRAVFLQQLWHLLSRLRHRASQGQAATVSFRCGSSAAREQEIARRSPEDVGQSALRYSCGLVRYSPIAGTTSYRVSSRTPQLRTGSAAE
jgi:hypothetical protein